SVMLFNNARCKSLTPDYVNGANAADLHRFKWTQDELIGDLPLEWNWLVGEYSHNPAAKNVHFTRGGPYFEQYRECDYEAEWFGENRRMSHVASDVPA